MQQFRRCAGDLHAEAVGRFSTSEITVTDGDYAAGLKLARHDHELASLCVVLAGGYDEGFGRRSRRVGPGSVIVHPAGEHHDQRHDPISTRVLTVELSDGLLARLGREGEIVREAWHRTDPGVVSLACGVRREIRAGDATSRLAVEALTMEMLARLGSQRVTDASGAHWLAWVRDRLESGSSPPRLGELSDLVGVHPVHLARAFRRRFGCSVGDYARRVQVGRAALLLEESELPLAAVASDAGFADQSHMTRVFRDETGVTPGAWRRRIGDRRAT